WEQAAAADDADAAATGGLGLLDRWAFRARAVKDALLTRRGLFNVGVAGMGALADTVNYFVPGTYDVLPDGESFRSEMIVGDDDPDLADLRRPREDTTIKGALEAGDKANERAFRFARGEEARQAAKGGDADGDAGGGGPLTEAAPAEEAGQGGGPRVVINPTTFKNDKDALCVAFNEALRIVMEAMGFEPQAEPTPAQRRFFADTAYADDELQLRRTILARICVSDTSIS
ncbi:MAG: hypothetical protein HUJ63_03535, partial [Enterococcus sp.]|nr:hypothetical protein [Enterococcus sp.]